MKEFKIMKALRHLLIVAALVSFLGANAQELAQQPEVQMQSTSILSGSGSSLPSAAADGVSTTNEQAYSPSREPSGPRRGRPGDWTDPYKDPLGDVIWPLMLFACAYVILRAARKVRKKVE